MVIRCWTSSAWTDLLNGYVRARLAGRSSLLHGMGMPVAWRDRADRYRFRQAVARFAENNDVPMVKFRKGIRKVT